MGSDVIRDHGALKGIKRQELIETDQKQRINWKIKRYVNMLREEVQTLKRLTGRMKMLTVYRILIVIHEIGESKKDTGIYMNHYLKILTCV